MNSGEVPIWISMVSIKLIQEGYGLVIIDKDFQIYELDGNEREVFRIWAEYFVDEADGTIKRGFVVRPKEERKMSIYLYGTKDNPWPSICSNDCPRHYPYGERYGMAKLGNKAALAVTVSLMPSKDVMSDIAWVYSSTFNFPSIPALSNKHYLDTAVVFFK